MQEPAAPWPLPDIAPEFILDFDLFNIEPIDGDLHAGFKRWHDGPDFFYSPLNGGHWVATRAEDIFNIYRDSDRFSNQGVALFREKTGDRFIPAELDPPIHGAFRKVLNPETSPRRIRDLEAGSRALACELIDGLVAKKRCEFHDDIAQKLPIYNFLAFMNLPREDTAQLMGPSSVITRNPDRVAFGVALQQINDYIDARIEERISNPVDDFISRLMHADIDGRQITRTECRITVLNVMLGGLDTTTGSMGFFMHFLAQHPEHRRQLVAEPDLIPEAIEELLRRHGIFNTGRLVKEECEFAGFTLRKNDLVLLPTTLHNLDERRFPDPMTVDFGRRDKNHLTFGAGIHRCLGSNFARSQIRIMLEEWLLRIPEFELDAESAYHAQSGSANAVTRLPLVW
jgi:cytochrome P450